MNILNTIHTVTISSMAFSGHGIAELLMDGGTTHNLYVLGAYVGDEVKVKVYHQGEGGKYYAELLAIVSPSQDRINTPPHKPFYHPQAPWQYLSFEAENRYKETFLKQTFNIKDFVVLKNGTTRNHYRNKETSTFIETSPNNISYALYTRGIEQPRVIASTENILVDQGINHVATMFLDFFNRHGVRKKDLHFVQLRKSNVDNTFLVQIGTPYASRKKLPFTRFDIDDFMEKHSDVSGLEIIQTQQESRSTRALQTLYNHGEQYNTMKLHDKVFKVTISQFFQINTSVFELIIDDMKNYVTVLTNNDSYILYDLYAGVGAIGFSLASLVHKVVLVEHSLDAKESMEKNMSANDVTNAEVYEQSVDDLDFEEDINDHKTIICVDPPRSGLSRSLITKINNLAPELIIYLSCNPQTQQRDLSLLNNYRNDFMSAYNMFPQTPHIENLVILKRNKGGK